MDDHVAEREHQEQHESFETSKSTSSDAPPQTRPHLRILAKQFHQLEAMYSNRCALGAILIQNTTSSLVVYPSAVPDAIGAMVVN